ncbi:hypothetical protein [Nocardia abscessus]|uniref:hypothetical protein n=1 Tax=Nocardia abscessus TaxID=120957 RepID=UPI002453804A|nr:hypothetical protein [Nocardia abscessus]
MSSALAYQRARRTPTPGFERSETEHAPFRAPRAGARARAPPAPPPPPGAPPRRTLALASLETWSRGAPSTLAFERRT